MVNLHSSLQGTERVREVFERLEPPTDEARARARELAKFILDFTARKPEVKEGAYAPTEVRRVYVRGVGRDIYVELLRELADRAERGDNDCSRGQWINGYGELVAKEGPFAGAVISTLECVVREPGRVRLQTCEIAEENHNPEGKFAGDTPAHLIQKRPARLVVVEG